MKLSDIESSHKLREEFAKACFETLLQFSFISPPNGDGTLEEGAITHLAIESLLSRCKTVLQKFINDERLSGKCPLPRSVFITALISQWGRNCHTREGILGHMYVGRAIVLPGNLYDAN